MSESTEPHSLAYIGDHRLKWWNEDFVALLGQRARLNECKTILDVGAGAGHWLATLLPAFRLPCAISALDIEKHWLDQLKGSSLYESTKAQGCAWSFIQGDCLDIPCKTDSFDCVTCQTVLMHQANPIDALREFVRVARPGGVVLVTEPLNLLNRVPMNSLTFNLEPLAHAQLFQFWRCHELGLLASGRGFHSLGMELPFLFEEAGLVGNQYFSNDRSYLSDENADSDPGLDQLPRPAPEDYALALAGGASRDLTEWAVEFFKNPSAYRLKKNLPCPLRGAHLAQCNMIVGIGFKPGN